ncbi:MAG: VOC family protein [Acidimicrobiales bacterium]
MTTLTSFDEGMPCWVDVMVPTQEQHLDKRAFLSALFDWTWQEGGPETGHYDLALSNGHPVMGLGVTDDGNGAPTTYFSTKEIGAAVGRATELGATVIVPAMEVMDLGWMAILVDPVGAMYGLWQPEGFQGFGVAYEENAPGWFDQVSLDPERAGEFYAALSGHDVTSPAPDMRVLQNGEQWYASVSHSPTGEAPQWKPIYVVDSLERIHELVTRHGGTILIKEMPVPGSAISTFIEPVNGTPMTVMRGGQQPEGTEQ